MEWPLLSVCLLTYNHEKYIRQAIDSILSQKVTFTWQLIIADDCSTDKTQDILLEYKKQYPELIHLILQKKNVGPEENWLELLSHPKSKYLLYAEGDDYFTDPNKLQKQVDFLEAHPDFTLCFHSVRVVYQDDAQSDEIFPSSSQRFNKTVLEFGDLLKNNFIQTNSAMYRWDFNHRPIKQSFPRGIVPGDWFLHLLHAKAGKIGFINRSMAAYRRHSEGMWWESTGELDVIWKRYGMQHLAMYIEMLRLCGEELKYTEIVRMHIDNMLNNFIEVDEVHQTGLIGSALQRFPRITEDFIFSQHRVFKRGLETLQKKEQELSDLTDDVRKKDQLLKRAQEELVLVKSSRFWKVRNKIAQLIGKSVI